jgi:glutamate racemase
MAIGVFDSGVGGLSVHHKLVERFPTADFVYLADQANTPYGGRAGEEIVELTMAGCVRLFDQGCDLIVLQHRLGGRASQAAADLAAGAAA